MSLTLQKSRNSVLPSEFWYFAKFRITENGFYKHPIANDCTYHPKWLFDHVGHVCNYPITKKHFLWCKFREFPPISTWNWIKMRELAYCGIIEVKTKTLNAWSHSIWSAKVEVSRMFRGVSSYVKIVQWSGGAKYVSNNFRVSDLKIHDPSIYYLEFSRVSYALPKIAIWTFINLKNH